MIKRLPPWFRQEIPRNIHLVRNRLRDFENHKLNTVCLSAHCPNINACFENNSVTFMLLGNICSRNCNFCAVEKGNSLPLALLEPYELALTARRMNLRYAVITSVTRDDLSSGGATQYARAVYLTRRLNPEIKIELLIPDFKGSKTALGLVVKSRPDIIGHNLETAQGLYAKIREKAIDLGFRYGYRLGVYGTLRFTYFRRVLARSCPAEVNAFIFSYLLPFSF